MRICLMVEGQEDVAWEDWVAIADACEAAGFEALFRSDHYLSVEGRRERGSLDAWATLAALAAVTTELRLGTLVSPVTFRHPSVLARTAVTVDHVSGGRLEVGVGAGWYEAEHAAFGFPFPEPRTRFDLLEEQLATLRREWGADSDARPKPVQPGGPPVLLGGNAGPRSAALAARYADEYNTVYATPAQCRERRARIAAACQRAGRDPLPFSVMTGFLIGADRGELEQRRRRLAEWRGDDELRPSWIVGTVPEALEQLQELAEAGVERVMLQHLLHNDFEVLDLIGREVIPRLAP